MPSASPAQLLPALLAQHHAAVRTLIDGLSKLTANAQAEMLAAHLEAYLDQLRAQETQSAGFLPPRKTSPAPDATCAALTAPWPEKNDYPDLLLARTALRVIHLQIASLGVLQTLADPSDDARLQRFLREAMEAEIESEEDISIWLEEAASPAPVEL